MSLPKSIFISIVFAIALPISANAQSSARETSAASTFDAMKEPVQLTDKDVHQNKDNIIIVQSVSRRRVLSFRTQSYTVRVDKENDSYLMSVYDRRNEVQLLDKVPAEASSGSASTTSNDRPIGTVFSAQQGNLIYTAFENATGNPTLIILPPQDD